jgi:hypothetical protein
LLEIQREAAARAAFKAFTLGVPPGSAKLGQIEQDVEVAWGAYQGAMRRSWHTRPLVILDDFLRRPRVEMMDRPSLSDERRRAALSDLDRINNFTGYYEQAIGALRPFFGEAAARNGGSVRLLELASGHGELIFRLARAAPLASVRLKLLVGSDIQPSLMAQAHRRAKAEGVKAQFVALDATDLSAIPDRTFDLIVTLQSLHHFSPGKVGRALHEAFRVSKVGVVAVDLRRGLLRVPKFGVGAFSLSLNPDLAHDATVSAAKAYDEAELGLIARIAVPGAELVQKPVGKDLQLIALRRPV